MTLDLERVRSVLQAAVEALMDLGACDDEDCQEPVCSHALPRARKLLAELNHARCNRSHWSMVRHLWKLLFSERDTRDVIGMAICDALRPILPDIRYTLGWAEAGPDTLCFWCDGREVSRFSSVEGMVGLCELLSHLFRERGIEPSVTIDTPFGVYLTQDEAKKVQEALVRLLDGE